ncbi:MAG: MFS transporter [Alphaproteobacteria bacterium]|nr:MFS transporter [Alphaproteobacteria bacterium]
MSVLAGRGTILQLAFAQLFYSSVIIMVFASAGIVGLTLAPERGLATLPPSAFYVGSILSTIPASFLMQRFGRKPVFMMGAAVAVLGSALAVWAILTSSFWLFCLAILLHGVFQATSNFYSFAASEAARPEDRSVAISWVLTGGVLAAILATKTVGYTADSWTPYTYAGSYIVSAGYAAVNLLIVATTALPLPRKEQVAGPQRPWGELLGQPNLVVAMLAGAVSYGLMSFMMTAGPVAMTICGFDHTASSSVLQWHVLGMFIPSFFTGSLIKRFGVTLITAIGMVILVASAVAGLMGISFANFSAALILLGIGWNFGFIGGTTMLTECYRPSERAKVQGVNNFVVSGLQTIASFSSGGMLAFWGWNSVPLLVIPVSLLMLLLIGWMRGRQWQAQG